MKKRKSLAKKIQRLKDRIAKDNKKLAKLTTKLNARPAASGKKKSAKPAAKNEPAPKVKRKLNLSPERRAQLAETMKARWAAKRAAASGQPPRESDGNLPS